MDTDGYLAYWTPTLPGHLIVEASDHTWYMAPIMPGGWDQRRPYRGHLDGLTRYPPQQARVLVDLIDAGFYARDALTRPWAIEDRWRDPADLIPIAEAARLVSRHPNTISTCVDMGLLRWWPNPQPSRNPRKAQRLVSRADVLARWHDPILAEATDKTVVES